MRYDVLFRQVTNVVLSYLLVSNGFGITGADIALISSDIIGICYVLKRYFSSSERSRKICFISIKIWAIYQILGNTGDEDAMTLYAICMVCLSVVSMCITGCNGAMTLIVGMLYSEKDFGGVRILVKYVLKIALTLSGAFVNFKILFP